MGNFDALKDFELHSAVSNETLEKYQGLVPPELFEIWKDYGYGTFFNGYLKIINPVEYQEILEESYFDGKISLPIFTTGFGDIIYWRNNEYLGLIEYRKNQNDVLSYGFDFFFSDLISGKRLVQKLDKSLYNEAVSKYGSLKYDECFGFVPLLLLGGAEKLENLQKVKIKTHIDLITQSIGRIE